MYPSYSSLFDQVTCCLSTLFVNNLRRGVIYLWESCDSRQVGDGLVYSRQTGCLATVWTGDTRDG